MNTFHEVSSKLSIRKLKLQDLKELSSLKEFYVIFYSHSTKKISKIVNYHVFSF